LIGGSSSASIAWSPARAAMSLNRGEMSKWDAAIE
jgi:hypothetical protein